MENYNLKQWISTFLISSFTILSLLSFTILLIYMTLEITLKIGLSKIVETLFF